MKKQHKQWQGFVGAALGCGAGTALLCVSLVSWLTTPELAQQIWPGDINTRVAELLGGTSGAAELSLKFVSVFWRAGVLLVACCALVYRFGHPGDSAFDRLRQPLRRTSLLFAVTSAWWVLWWAGPLLTAAVQSFLTASLALWLATSGGYFLWIWLSPVLPSLQRKSGRRTAITLLTLLVLTWTAVSFWMNYCLYQQLLIPHGDSAMYEEHIWNVWHGKGFRSYLDQGLFLGEHIQVIHLLLLPLHMIWPSHLCLELVESIALASCSIPVYLIARRHLGSAGAAAMLAAAWLFYYPMHFLDIAIDQKTFRPIALGLPFIFWVIEFAERGALIRGGVCLLVALSAKEDMALVLCPLLAVLAYRVGRDNDSCGTGRGGLRSQSAVRYWLAGGAVLCAVWLLVSVLVIIPSFRSGDHVHYARYFGDLGGTPGELVRTGVTDPLRVVAAALDLQTVLYVCVFLAPLGFLPLRRPVLLSAGVFTFGMLSLLELGDGVLPPVPYHHFHAPLLPVVFWAGIVAVSQPLRKTAGNSAESVQALSLLVLLCCMATSVTGSLMPVGTNFWSQESRYGYSKAYIPDSLRLRKRGAYAEIIVEMIPPTARVASTDYIHTRLTHCERSYDYSDYLRAVNNYEPGVPPDTDYIVIDTGHRHSKVRSPTDVTELTETPDQWELLPDTTDGMFIVLRRTRGPGVGGVSPGTPSGN